MPGPPPSHSIDDLLVHARWLNRLARHLVRDSDFAADLTQEVWLAAHRSPPDRARPVRPWLKEVLRNAVRMRLRRDGRQTRSEETAPLPEPFPSPAAVQEQLELQRELVEAVMTLDEPLRTVILLRFFEEKSSSEIARALQVPAGTVRWRLKMAVDRLRGELDRRCPGGRRQWALAFASGSIGKGTVGKGALVMAKMKTTGAALLLALLIGSGAWWLSGALPQAPVAPARSEQRPTQQTLRSGWALPEPDEGRPGEISGRVLDSGGRPVAEATITLVRGTAEILAGGRVTPSADVRADGRGAFVFNSVPAGRYMVFAMARGWAPGQAAVVVPDRGRVSVDLVLGAGGVVLSGRVFDAGGGPIAHASLLAVLSRPGPQAGPQMFVLRAVTDPQGRYALHTRPGQYTVRVEADGYASSEAGVNLLGGTRTRDFELAPAAEVSGRVLDRGSGAPVAGAEVMLAASEERGRRQEIAPVRTDDDGRYAFSAIGAGAYFASARKESLVSAAHELVVAAAGKAEMDLVVDAGRSVSGRVLDHEGRPVAGATVQVARTPLFFQEPPIKTVSAPDGNYMVGGLLPGVLRLRAKLDAFPSMIHQAITITGVDVENVDLRVDRPAILHGRVLAADGKPAVDIDLRVNTSDRRPDRSIMTRVDATTDNDGRFRLLVSPGEVKLSASGGDARGFADLGTVAAGDERTVTLTMVAVAADGRISGTVKDQDGRALADVGVTLHGERDLSVVRSDDAGRFAFQQLDAGAYLVIAQSEEDSGSRGPWNASEAKVTLSPGQQRLDLALVLPATTEIRGQVVDAEGRPVPSATVLASPEQDGRIAGGTPRRAFADGEGHFVVKSLPRLPHALTALHQQHPNAIARGVRGGQSGVVLRFAPGSELAGRARDDHGRPITDYLLRVKSDSGTVARQIHDPAGRFRVPRANAGSVALTALTATGAHGTAEVTLPVGATREDIELVLAPGIEVAVRMIDAVSGTAVANAEVRASTDMSEQTKLSDSEGRVAFPKLPPGGKARLFATAPGYAPANSQIDVPSAPAAGATVVKLTRTAAAP